MKKFTLDWELERVKSQIDKLRILEITKNEKFTLIKAIIECPLYFAFYENFIICSGDYGEWIFDCTWKTNNNGNHNYSSNMNYLLGKLSRNNKKYISNFECFEYYVIEWFKDWKKDNEQWKKLKPNAKKEVRELVEKLISDFEDYRTASLIDDFRNEFKELTGYDFDDDYSLYTAHERLDGQLVVNLGCLLKIKELLISFKEEIE